MLITQPGTTTSNSYATLEEAEQIIASSGMSTPLWQSLTTDQGVRVTGTVSEPFLPITDVSDKFSISINEGETQVVTFPESESPSPLTALEVCVLLNTNLTGVTATPTSTNKIKLSVDNPTDTLNILTVSHSAYSILGLTVGCYTDILPTQKEYLLKLSAQMIGYLPLSGIRLCKNQALDFPRQVHPNFRDVDYLDSFDSSEAPEELLIIPDEVKESQALLACLVVLPNLTKQVELSEALSIPAALQNAIVNQVQVANVISVKTSSSSSSSSVESSGVVNRLASLANVFTLPVYMLMKKHLSQVGGGSLVSKELFDSYLYDEIIATEDVPIGD